MVTADRNSEDVRNGKRSRGPSPNGHLSDDSSATDDSEQENGMRVGDDYQAKIPSYNPDAKSEPRAEAMLVWAPHLDLPDAKINEYIAISKEKYGYNTEQALGMLFWHKHNIEKALADLQNFTPFPDEWTVEDKVLFEQAFSFHGKSFMRIRQMLPDKSIASLVKYYYSWKKTRSRTSLMDRQARKLTHKPDDSDYPDDGSGNSDSDFETQKENGKDGDGKNVCSNCGAGVSQLHSTPKGGLCSSCFQYWRRTGVMRSSSSAKRLETGQLRHNPMKKKSKPPRGMYMDNSDLRVMATGPPGQGDALIKSLEAELVSLKRQVQNNKQILSMQKHKTSSGIESFKSPEAALRINPRWTNEELLLAVQGVRKYGKNFKAIAEVIGNKTESHVRSYFVNYRRRYNLDEVLAEYEAEHPSEVINDEEEKMETEAVSNNNKKAEPEVVPAVTSAPSSAVNAPPPLLKQSPAPSQSPRQPPPLHSQNRLHPAMISKPGLQNPPPLIRPNSAPIIPHSKMPFQHGPPPHLTGRD